MSERAYRQRLEADIERWHADGVISTTVADAIRGSLRPLPEAATVAVVVGIVGGLLIAAAFLAFIAANWMVIARPARFLILLAGIIGAYSIGAWFDRTERTVLADLSVAVGSIVFGAAIALTGQMYHLAADFAAGLLLWAGGALIAAVLTGSRGALAVALAAACVWNGMRVFETDDIHLPFVFFWLVAAGLALAWNAPVARHLVALAAVVWWVHTGLGATQRFFLFDPSFTVAAGASLMLGGGLALAIRAPESRRAFGMTLSHYGAFALAFALAWIVAGIFGAVPRRVPVWITWCGVAGAVLAFVAAAIERRVALALAGISIALALIVVSGVIRPSGANEPWAVYALALASMLCLVISGMLDDVRPRIVAGWVGLGLSIAAITWAVKGSLLHRAAFLAAAGIIAVALAILLGRLLRREAAR